MLVCMYLALLPSTILSINKGPNRPPDVNATTTAIRVQGRQKTTVVDRATAWERASVINPQDGKMGKLTARKPTDDLSTGVRRWSGWFERA